MGSVQSSLRVNSFINLFSEFLEWVIRMRYAFIYFLFFLISRTILRVFFSLIKCFMLCP